VSALIGTPLSTEELKSIIGGAIMSGDCTCSYHRTGPLYDGAPAQHTTTLAAQSSAACQKACAHECDNDMIYKCAAYDWKYKEEAHGSWHN